MITAELTLIPIGTSSTSLSKYIAAGINVLDKMGVKYEVNGLGTLIETDSADKLFDTVKAVHEALFDAGAQRVATHLKIDDRRDFQKTLEDKVKSVREKLV